MPSRNTILQLLTPYTDPIPSNSHPQNLQIFFFCISLSWSRDRFVQAYVAANMREYCCRGDH